MGGYIHKTIVYTWLIVLTVLVVRQLQLTVVLVEHQRVLSATQAVHFDVTRMISNRVFPRNNSTQP